MSERFCMVFKNGEYCKNGGGQHWVCKGCWKDIEADMESKAAYNIYVEGHMAEFEAQHKGTTVRPNPFFNADAKCVQLTRPNSNEMAARIEGFQNGFFSGFQAGFRQGLQGFHEATGKGALGYGAAQVTGGKGYRYQPF